MKIEGYATFEILSIIIPETKLGTVGKLSKLEFLTELRARPMFSSLTGKGKAALERLASFLLRLETTKMCFIAGTPVHTDTGLKNIEQIVVGDLVLSRDEATGEQAWKTVLDTVTTRPTELFDIHLAVKTERGPPTGLSSDGKPVTEEKLTTTAEHPFFVANRAQPGFVAARELEAGDELLTAAGGTATVTEIVGQEATPGEPFTTYNFEVADFHTYFVGVQGVWVHNAGRTHCEKMFSLYERYRRGAQAASETPYETLVRMKAIALSKKSDIPGRVWRLAAKEVNDEMFHLVATGQLQLSDLPSVLQWRARFSGMGHRGRKGVAPYF